MTAAIMASITYAQFINAGIITLMTNANLQFVPILNFIFPFLRMQYSDLGVGWYLNIGTVLTAAMKSLAMQPWIQLAIGVVGYKVGKFKDYHMAGKKVSAEGEEPYVT
jgi:hypothetical protein